MKVVWVEQQQEQKRNKRDFASNPAGLFALGRGSEFPDPFYRDQWYLVSKLRKQVRPCFEDRI